MAIQTFGATGNRPAVTGCNTSDSNSLWVRRGAWWMHPAWTGILTVLPCLAVTWITPDKDFRLWWRTPKYFDSAGGLTTLLLLGAFVLGAIAPCLARRRVTTRNSQLTATTAQQRILLRAGQVFLALTLAGYSTWAALAVSRGYGGKQLYDAIRLDQNALIGAKHQYFFTTPGVTTLTQFGPLAIACFLLDRRIRGRSHRWALAVLAILTLARVFVNTERLALFEAIAPAIVLAAGLQPGKVHPSRHKMLWALLPILAPLILVVVFGIFEYTRSWNDFYALHGNMGFGEFVMIRLGGYYATASNNSAILLNYIAPYTTLPSFTVPFIWNFPIVRSLFGAHSTLGAGSDQWSIVLKRFANPEYVNDGSVLLAVADYGFAGALIWWAVIGLILGICYRWLRAGELRGFVLYAVIYVGLLEMGRIFYWGLGRAFPVIVGGIVISVFLHRARSREDRVPTSSLADGSVSCREVSDTQKSMERG